MIRPNRTSTLRRRRMVTNRPEKGTRRWLKDQLDKAVSKLVRARDKRCVICGTTENLTAGHLYSRRYVHIRWDLMNVHAQCVRCNFLHNEHPHKYFDWFVETYGQGELDRLNAERFLTKEIPDAELEKMLADYKNVLKAL